MPMIVDARVSINITVLSNKSDVFIYTNCSGYDYKVVTDAELKLFNITTARLDKSVKVHLGNVSDDIYLKHPTPHGDLFNKFNGTEMRRRLTVKRSQVIDIINEDFVLDTHEHINNTTNDITSQRSMYDDIENRISSTWSATGLPNDEIFTNFTIDFGYGNLSYVRKWRNESTQMIRLPIGVTEKGLITIKPGQTVVTKLKVSKTIVVLKLVYEAELSGQLILSYASTLGKYHFYAPAVKDIMKAGNMTNEVITTEILEVRCFTNPRLEVYDKLTGVIIEPFRKKRPRMKIIRKNNTTRIIYIKTKKPKRQRKIKKINVS